MRRCGITSAPLPFTFVWSWTCASVLLAFAVCSPGAAPDLFDGFGPRWREKWEDERFFGKGTQYDLTVDAGRTVLHARSHHAHGGLLRRITIDRPTDLTLEWEWKVLAPLEGNHRERERAGDDFAARVLVIFEPSVLPWRTRALSYVWAAHEPLGATYPSPYAKNVATIVVESGPVKAGSWQAERRDAAADYRAYFGEPPSRVSGVAVLVDTDDTGLAAEAWFGKLTLQSAPLPKP